MHLAGFLWLRLGLWLDQKGMPVIAESALRQAGGSNGRFAAEAMRQLGKRLMLKGRYADAAKACRQATCLNPQDARAWCGLGAAQRYAGEMDAARDAYERALCIDPDYPEALTNLGEWWLVRGEPLRALDQFDQVLRRNPGFYEAIANRVVALFECDRVTDAEQAARDGIELFPDSAPLLVNLGNVLVHMGKGRPGLLAYRRALELEPGNEEANYNVTILQHDTAAFPAAIEFIRRQIAVKGETANRLVMLATAYKAKGEYAEAESICRDVLERHPNHVSALILLAGASTEGGDPAYAIECYEKAMQQRPEMAAIYSNIIFESTYLPDLSPETVYRRHRQWAERYEDTVRSERYDHPLSDDPERRLRIGYVSGDFCNHPVGTLFRDVLGHHERKNYEIHCYSNFHVSDPITEVIRAEADVWHDVALMADSDVAAMIHDDKIDILIDLSGHTAFNRLTAFALKPAPVQATWIGYFHSTGMQSIDYFISDPHTSPRGCGQMFSEIPVHLPHSRFCYAPPDYVAEVADSPVMRNGYVTFGSFNRLAKLTRPVIAAWTAILNGTPGSKLIIKTRGVEDESKASRLREQFVACGLAPDRLVLRPSSGHRQMFREYGDIDIALDPFPFTGGMTTLEALWMGVPVVTWAGNSVVSRQTVSALNNVGYPELAFPDSDAYVAGAIALAGDTQRLTGLRRELRPRMAASPLRQPDQFARDLEDLYRRMWRARCEGRRLSSDV